MPIKGCSAVRRHLLPCQLFPISPAAARGWGGQQKLASAQLHTRSLMNQGWESIGQGLEQDNWEMLLFYRPLENALHCDRVTSSPAPALSYSQRWPHHCNSHAPACTKLSTVTGVGWHGGEKHSAFPASLPFSDALHPLVLSPSPSAGRTHYKGVGMVFVSMQPFCVSMTSVKG